MIDLHSHTNASDGQHSPSELLEFAARAKVSVLAVTDHDTVAGLSACQAEATRHGIQFVPGIELSVGLNRREVHILGHFIDPQNERLKDLASVLRVERDSRMQKMINKMVGLGFPITLDQVQTLAQGAQLGRPHLARVLVELNYCRSTKEAFDRFLRDRGPAWVERELMSPNEAIALIHQAGGTATLAHPGVSRIEQFELVELQQKGLDGLEVFHPDHSQQLQRRFLTSCEELKLIPTSGSDFHGAKVAPDRHLGSISMGSDHFLALQNAASSYATGKPN